MRKTFKPLRYICLLLLISFLSSCKSEQESLEDWLIEKFSKEINLTSNVYVCMKTSPTGVPHHYKGIMYFNANGMETEFPWEIWKDGRKKCRSLLISDSEANERLHSFIERANAAPKIARCSNWVELEDALSGDLLAEYQLLYKLRDNYYRQYQRFRSQSSVNTYNSFIREEIQPFCEKIGAKFSASYLLITEEERQKDIQSDKNFWEGEIKKARNRYVDEHPNEARRRGIEKF